MLVYQVNSLHISNFCHFLYFYQGAANSAETNELKTRTLQAGQDVAMQYRELLQTVLHILNRPGASDAKLGLPPISRRIAQSVTELVAVAELLKGTV